MLLPKKRQKKAASKYTCLVPPTQLKVSFIASLRATLKWKEPCLQNKKKSSNLESCKKAYSNKKNTATRRLLTKK
jgi:hypothetical protein